MRLVALAGGVGAARFLTGLVRACDPTQLTVVANTGDDIVLHGLHVSPDLDTITYTLGGGVDPDRGWGRLDDTTVVLDELRARYDEPGWFTLGDRDLATHLVRTEVLRAGGTLSDATRRIAAAWGLPFTLLPATDASVATMVRCTDGRARHFQQWWVGERAEPDVADVWLEGAPDAEPAPGVLAAIEDADAVLLCPSNPVVSIGTILAVPAIRMALRRVPVVGVSPIVGGAVVRGMADRLLPAVGVPVTAAGVAAAYADVLQGWVIDDVDADAVAAINRTGVRCIATDTIMRSPEASERLATRTLELVRELVAPAEEPGRRAETQP